VKPSLLAAVPLVSALVWVGALIVDPGGYDGLSTLLIGFGLLALATIGTVGFILAGGTWSQRLLTAVLASTFVLAIVRPFDAVSVVALVLSALGIVAVYAPRQQGLIRKLPSATGPPPDAVLVTLVALCAPLALGLIPVDVNVWGAVFCLISFGSGALYSQAVTGGLLMVRYGIPLAAIALATPMGPAHGAAGIAIGVTVAVVGRSQDVAVAFHPITEKGTTYPIPPELAPGEILDGAGLDERGRPRQ
jgi:hypothetical protein